MRVNCVIFCMKYVIMSILLRFNICSYNRMYIIYVKLELICIVDIIIDKYNYIIYNNIVIEIVLLLSVFLK